MGQNGVVLDLDWSMVELRDGYGARERQQFF